MRLKRHRLSAPPPQGQSKDRTGLQGHILAHRQGGIRFCVRVVRTPQGNGGALGLLLVELALASEGQITVGNAEGLSLGKAHLEPVEVQGQLAAIGKVDGLVSRRAGQQGDGAVVLGAWNAPARDRYPVPWVWATAGA